LAFTKEEKSKMVAQYGDWLSRSQAVFLVEYKGMRMKDIDALRAKGRDNGAELHVVKNTLFSLALTEAGISLPEKLTDGTTVAAFAFSDPPALAKLLNDAMKNAEMFKMKGGMLGKQSIGTAQVKALADLPPLPVIQAKLLGTLLAPASKLVRTLAEPGRSIASVIKAYSERQSAGAEPEAATAAAAPAA
jgi:large subunit ribosomal protein L10